MITTSTTEPGYPSLLFYGLNIPILALNVAIFAVAGWNGGSTLYHDGGDWEYARTSLLIAAASVSTAFILTLIGLTVFGRHLTIPSVVRVLVNSTVIIPLYVIMTVIVALSATNVYSQINHVSCFYFDLDGVQRSTQSNCADELDKIADAMRISCALAVAAIALTLVDTAYSLRLHRVKCVADKKLRFEEEPAEPRSPLAFLYAVNLPIIILDAATVGACAWVLSPAVQNPLLTDGSDIVGPMMMAVAAGVSMLFAGITLVLVTCGVRMPALARILPNCMPIIPLSATALAFLVIELTKWRGACNLTGYNDPEDYRRACDSLWHRINTAEKIAVALSIAAITLTLAEVVHAIQLRLAGAKARKDRDVVDVGKYQKV